MNDSLEVEVLCPAWWRRRTSEAQGRHREVGSEESVEQSRGPMEKKPDNEAYPVGRASNWSRSPRSSRVGVVNPAGVRRRRSVLPREVCAVSRFGDWGRR